MKPMASGLNTINGVTGQIDFSVLSETYKWVTDVDPDAVITAEGRQGGATLWLVFYAQYVEFKDRLDTICLEVWVDERAEYWPIDELHSINKDNEWKEDQTYEYRYMVAA